MFKSTQMKLNSRFLFLLFFSVKIVLISDRSITRVFWRFNYHHFFRVSFLSRTNRVALPPPTERKETFFVPHSVCDISCYKTHDPKIFFVYFTVVSAFGSLYAHVRIVGEIFSDRKISFFLLIQKNPTIPDRGSEDKS